MERNILERWKQTRAGNLSFLSPLLCLPFIPGETGSARSLEGAQALIPTLRAAKSPLLPMETWTQVPEGLG